MVRRACLLLVLCGLGACSKPPAGLPAANVGPSSAPPPPPAPAAEPALDPVPVPADGEHPIDFSHSRFEFEGYGPGKSHLGHFAQLSGTLTYQGGKLVKAAGTIDPASVDAGIDRLTQHLKTADFFDVEKYPEVTVESTSITGDGGPVTVKGKLTLHGVTQELEFPATVDGGTLSADFKFDATKFGISHHGVNPEVRIAFTLSP